MEEERKKLRRELNIVFMVSAAHFFSHYFYIALQPLFLFIQADLGLSFTQLGVMVSVFALASGLGHYPGGILIDRYGPRYFIIGGLAISSVTFVLIGFATSYWMLLVLAVVIGCADSVFHPADYSVLSNTVSEQRLGRSYSVHTFIGFVGFAVAPVVVVFLAGIWDWRVAISLSGLGGVATVVFLVFRRDLLPVEDAAGRVRTAKAAKAPGAGALSLLLSAPIILMFLFYMVGSFATSGIKDFSTVALVDFYSITVEQGAQGVSSFMLGIALGVLAGGVIADKFGRINLVATIGYLGAGVVILLISMKLLPFWLAIIGYLVAGFLTGVIMPSRDLLVKAVTPKGAEAKAFGLVTSGYGFGGAVGPIVFGAMMDLDLIPLVIAAPGIFLIMALVFALAAGRVGQARVAAQPAE